MAKTLVIKSGLFGENSKSNLLIEHYMLNRPSDDFVIRDLSDGSLPELNGELASGLRTVENLNEKQQQAVALSDLLIEEIHDADTLVIGAPMYNFAIPTQLKNWFDLICRAGKTFKYTESGPVGLLDRKQVIIVTTRGGLHQGKVSDVMTSHLKVVLNFIGLTDVKFVYAEGLNLSEDISSANIASAKASLLE